MGFVSFLFVAICLMSNCSAFSWFFSSDPVPDPDWDGLRVTFGVNPFTSFKSLPRTVSDAVEDGWTLKSSTCGGAFNGFRYIKNGDNSAMVLFDKNGYIAGLQAGIPKTKVYPKIQNAKYHVFLEESDKWVITAYFTDPSKICTTGRTEDEFKTEGTGTMLAIQNGPTAQSVMIIPMKEQDVESETLFVKGKCFYWMGMHYWYNVTTEMSCDDTFPVFLMYNEGKLNAFGWAFNPNYETSNRWEHPTANVFDTFIVDPPKCLGKDGPVTTMHVYLTDSPRSNYC